MGVYRERSGGVSAAWEGGPFPPGGGKGFAASGRRAPAPAPEGGEGYQTLQRFSGAMGAPALHWKASWNSGMFTTTPSAR
jgi:hypothetical protein